MPCHVELVVLLQRLGAACRTGYAFGLVPPVPQAKLSKQHSTASCLVVISPQCRAGYKSHHGSVVEAMTFPETRKQSISEDQFVSQQA